MTYNQFNNISSAQQAEIVFRQQNEKEHREKSNYINLQQLAEMVYENQKSSKRQFIATITISAITLLFAAFSCYIGYIQLFR